MGLGGFAGSALRYSASLLVRQAGWMGKWPLATLLVNILGSFLIGILWGRAVQIQHPQPLILLGIAGFCGGFTTFSAFSFETVELLRAGDYGLGLLYIGLSVILCMAATWAGLVIAGKA